MQSYEIDLSTYGTSTLPFLSLLFNDHSQKHLFPWKKDVLEKRDKKWDIFITPKHLFKSGSKTIWS